jgi:hypothetical protein
VIGLSVAVGVLLLLVGGGATAVVLSLQDEKPTPTRAPTASAAAEPTADPSPTGDSSAPSSQDELMRNVCGPAAVVARQQRLDLLGAPSPQVRSAGSTAGGRIEVACTVNADGIFLTATMTMSTSADDLAKTYALAQSTYWTYPPAKEKTPVPGVGDEAWASTRGTDASGGISYAVIARTADSVVVVTGTSGEEFGTARNKEVLIAMARGYAGP